MKLTIELTPEDISRVYDYINNDNREVLQSESIKRFTCVAEALNSKLMKNAYEDGRRIFLLERRLEHYEKTAEKNAAEGVFTETDRDSWDLAQALLYCLQQVKTYRLTEQKFMYIFYRAYASWLAGKKERLCAEHPVLSKWGVRFWRIHNRLNLKEKQPYEAFGRVAEQNPGIAAFLKRVANKYYDEEEKKIFKPILASDAYKNALPEKNNGKWNKEMTDADIYVWRKNCK